MVERIKFLDDKRRISSTAGVEKKNDDFRRYFHRKINKWDTCRDLLIVEKHLEKLQEHKRTPSPYQKKDDTFWIGGGKEEAARVQREKSLEGQLDKNWQELQSAVLEPAQQQPMMPVTEQPGEKRKAVCQRQATRGKRARK